MTGPITISATLRNPDGQEFVLSGVVTVEPKPLPAPIVLAVDPSTVAFKGGTVVTFTGQHFQQGMAIVFGDRPADNVVVSEDGTVATCTSPSFE